MCLKHAGKMRAWLGSWLRSGRDRGGAFRCSFSWWGSFPPQAQGSIPHPPSRLRGPVMLRGRKKSRGFVGDSLYPPTPSSESSKRPHIGQQRFSFTRFVFFSSALLADMMEEARVFFNFPTSPQWAPGTRPLQVTG